MELIVAMALFMIFSAGLSTTALGGYLTSLENARALQANALIIESWEALKSIRNSDWEEFENGTYGLSSWGGRWSLSGSSDSFSDFTRVVTIEEVLRDYEGDIVTSGAEVDPDTKKIAIQLSWLDSAEQPMSFSMASYLTHYADPTDWPPIPPEPPPEP